MKSLRGRGLFIAIITLLAIYYVSPTLVYFSLPKAERNDQELFEKALPDWLPQKHIKLGLDLQGGVQLVLGVDTQAAIDNKLGRLGTEISRWANESKKQVKEAYSLEGQQTLRILLEPGVDSGLFKQQLSEEYPGLKQVNREGEQIDFVYADSQLNRIREAALEQAERVVRNRVDKWGVSEPAISRRADKSILVQLPGFKDPDKARELLGRTAQLQFKMVDEEFEGFKDLKLPETVTSTGQGARQSLISEDKATVVSLVKDQIPEGRELLFEERKIAGGTKTQFISYVVKAATELSGEDVLDASVSYDPNSLSNDPVVSMQFTGSGGKRFADITGENVGKRMAIVLDDIVVSAPVINTKISGGSAQITLGSDQGFQQKQQEALDLALILRSGALPAPITILEERQVGATLGPELANQGVLAVGLGFLLVIVYMSTYYRRLGFISTIALAVNGLLLLMFMASFGFSLTLPGFAGMILTLGMAVDANVLINERIRQEYRNGKPFRKAIENGFAKVFWTIIDSNVTTLIAAFVLIETNSSGPIKGFAVALIIGLLTSMFTALYVTRFLFDFVFSRISSEKKATAWLLGGSSSEKKQRSFDFLKFGKLSSIIGLLLATGVIAVGASKGVNWSVDFVGGTELEILFEKDIESAKIRSALVDAGIDSSTLQKVGEQSRHYLIRFEGGDFKIKAAAQGENSVASVDNLRDKLLTSLSDYGPDLQRVDFVGPLIGKELRKQGLLSVIWSILGILIYIGLRFDMRFGPGAIYKMVQDVFVIMGFYIFFQRSFDLTSVAAILTVVGYSVNDTIVIYDRIRENLSLSPRNTLYETINRSINETLSRSINTSVTTVIALVGILTFGSAQIWNFAAAMAVGVFSATLTSIFLASVSVLWFANWKKQRASQKLAA